MFIFQQATNDNADDIAHIVASANGSLVAQLFEGLIFGLSATSILSAAFIKGEGPYKTENITCSFDGPTITSMIFAYPAADHCIPLLLESFVPRKRLDPVRAILEKSIPDSLYVNTAWIIKELRTEAYSKTLLAKAEEMCVEKSLDSISLFCWNNNENKLEFLRDHGFSIAEHLPYELIPVNDHTDGGSLLYKPLASM